jgi:hypothetical protein
LVEIAITLSVRSSVEVEVHAYTLPDIEVERLRKIIAECDARGAWVLLVRFEDDVAGEARTSLRFELLNLSDVFDLSCKIHVVLF